MAGCPLVYRPTAKTVKMSPRSSDLHRPFGGTLTRQRARAKVHLLICSMSPTAKPRTDWVPSRGLWDDVVGRENLRRLKQGKVDRGPTVRRKTRDCGLIGQITCSVSVFGRISTNNVYARRLWRSMQWSVGDVIREQLTPRRGRGANRHTYHLAGDRRLAGQIYSRRSGRGTVAEV